MSIRRNAPRRSLGVLLGATLAAGVVTAVAWADDISNSLDPSIDAVAEVMPLTQGGPAGTTTLYVNPTNGDGKNGCNLTGSTTLVLSVSSNNTSVATVSPSSVTFASCGDVKTLTVTPHSQGTATISVSQTSNNTGATFNLAPATFTVNVAPPPNTPPNVTVSGVTGGASYNKGSVPAASCSVTDAEDGNSSFPATLSAISGPYATDGIGSQTASCSYTDAGGATATDSVTYSIVDPTPPGISYLLTPAAPDGSNGWYTSDVTLVWTVTEPQSPNSLVTTGCDDQNITSDLAETTFSCSATSAGGSAGPVDVTIKRDASKPALSCGTAPSGWQPDNVSVACSASDVGPSGLADPDADGNFQLSTDVDAGEETDSAMTDSRTVFDNAGNSKTIGPLGPIMVDRKAPVVTLTCPAAPVIKGSSANASWTATDGGSGFHPLAADSGTVQLDTSSVGTKTANLAAGATRDFVGNQSAAASCSYSVIYDWAGFFQPIDNKDASGDYILNKAKAGSTIPVKFSLGGNQGLNIFEAGYPKVSTTPCDSDPNADLIEEYSTATTSGLKYDGTVNPPIGQYIYNWKTDSKWSGQCRSLIVKLTDGTSHRADFNFFK
jgi:hypothetical protein